MRRMTILFGLGALLGWAIPNAFATQYCVHDRQVNGWWFAVESPESAHPALPDAFEGRREGDGGTDWGLHPEERAMGGTALWLTWTGMVEP